MLKKSILLCSVLFLIQLFQSCYYGGGNCDGNEKVRYSFVGVNGYITKEDSISFIKIQMLTEVATNQNLSYFTIRGGFNSAFADECVKPIEMIYLDSIKNIQVYEEESNIFNEITDEVKISNVNGDYISLENFFDSNESKSPTEFRLKIEGVETSRFKLMIELEDTRVFEEFI